MTLQRTVTLVVIATCSLLSMAQSQSTAPQRKKMNCNAFYKQSEKDRTLTLKLFGAEMSLGSQNKPLLTMDSELAKINLEGKVLCEQYNSDKNMSFNDFWNKWTQLQSKALESKRATISAVADVHTDVKVDVFKKGTAKNQ